MGNESDWGLVLIESLGIMNPCEGIHFAELCDQFQKIEDMSSAGSKETKNAKFTTIFTGNLLKRM